MSSGASLSLPDGLFAPYEVVRQLGARPNALYVVRQSGVVTGGRPTLAVAERYAGAVEAGSGGEDIARDARRIATLASPNLARVREVVLRGGDLVVIGEFVEGEKLQELWGSDKLPLESALRVVVDALAGLGALHNLRDSKQQPMKLAHGEVSPATIVLGLDGIARVLHSVSRRAPGVQPDAGSRRYLSPEVASGDPYDARADVFSAGVLLWEALSGGPLFREPDPEANARRVRSGPLPPAKVSEKAVWAKGLVEVAAKALSAAPDERWPTAAVMAAELRKAAGLKLAPASTAAAFARSGFGERVKARREALDASSPPSRAPAPMPVSAQAAAPPPPPPKLPEPSFLEVELESALDTVLVAPGIRAPVAEVIELGSDVLLEAASNSSVPPAPSSALGGFVRDPFAGQAAFAPAAAPPEMPRATPPPAPAVAVAPVMMIQSPPIVDEPPPPSITGAPHFAAAIDLPSPPFSPAVPAPYQAAPPPPSPQVEVPAEEAGIEVVAAGRRKVLVLGGVAVLGVVIFLLAAMRLARREPDVRPAAVSPPAPTVSAAQIPSPAMSAGPPPASAPASAPSSASTRVATTPPAQITTLHAPPVAAKPTPVAAAATPRTLPAAQNPAAAKPRPKPTFDPNSL